MFSYYFLKLMLLFNCNAFLEWSLENSGETLEFKNPETNVRKFADALVFAKYRDPALILCLKHMNARFFKRKPAVKKSFIYNTMRMTANEIV